MSVICSLHTIDLRTAVVNKRRSQGVTGKRSKKELGECIRMHKRLEPVPSELESMTNAQLVARKAELVDKYHPVPSKQSRDDLLKYVYFVANKLKWHWPNPNPGLSNRATRKCLGSRTPGSHPEPPKAILSRANRGPPRKPSAYNLYVKEIMTANKDAIPDARERFADAVRSWNQKKEHNTKGDGAQQETQKAGQTQEGQNFNACTAQGS